jgi:predicted O-methyltransferase YrrM
MRRKALIILIAAFIAVSGSPFLLMPQSASDSGQAATATNPGPKEITIRNVTMEVVTYTLKPEGSKSPPVEKHLAVGAVDRIATTQVMVITYKRHGQDISYSLAPGKPYSFRYDSSGVIDIWLGSHGRGDAEDLAPWVPTPPEVIAKMLEMAGVKKDDIVYDIGCGDGRIVIAAAQKYGARGVGIDIDPVRIKESKANAAKAGVEKLVRFILADATKEDISEATIVTLYLLPESNELLRPKFDQELRPGTPVVSHNYEIPGWEAKEVGSATLTDAEGIEHYVFLYKK